MMKRKIFGMLVAVMTVLTMVTPALANPPAPDADTATAPQSIWEVQPTKAKPIDQPNVEAYRRLMERRRLLSEGRFAEANALATTGTANNLVLLVEFAGTDSITLTAGVTPTFDYLGDPFSGCVAPTQTMTVTFTGPMHNAIPRPLSKDDRSYDQVWTPDFGKKWYEEMLFGNGPVISYTTQAGEPVNFDFTGYSMHDYYNEQSNGVFTVTGVISGWLQVPHSTAWYGMDACGGARTEGFSSYADGHFPNGGSPKTLVEDTIRVLTSTYNLDDSFWAQFDEDGDGNIERLWIVHAGYGEEDSTTLLGRTDYGENAIWSHSSGSINIRVSPNYTLTHYIMMPENGGVGVFAHEFAHSIGTIDLYSYNYGETSVGFWSLMCDDWTSFPTGAIPPSLDPYHSEYEGWFTPTITLDENNVGNPTQVVLYGPAGAASATNPPLGATLYRGVRINLPDGQAPLPYAPAGGDWQWWGGKSDLANGMMVLSDTIDLTGATTATLTFDLAGAIEEGWDFLFVQVTTDTAGISGWKSLSNTMTTSEHDPRWIGSEDDLPGITGDIGDWQKVYFSLDDYAGQQIKLRFWYMTDWATTEAGPFLDNIAVVTGSGTVFSDDAESDDGKWQYVAPWQRIGKLRTFKHHYLIEWRGPKGFDEVSIGNPHYRFGPINWGMVVWYVNEMYNDNEILGYLEDFPSFGPKGAALVIDSHPMPYRDPNATASTLGQENTNLTSRMLMRDAAFNLNPSTVDFDVQPPYVVTPTHFTGRPGVSAFDDSHGYYPGVAYEGSRGYWSTVDWDASAVVPAKAAYKVAGGSGYPGYHIQYLGIGWYGFWFAGPGGSGNPGDENVQYGWHVEVTDQANDMSWGQLAIYQQNVEVSNSVDKSEIVMKAPGVYTVTYQTVIENKGGAISDNVYVTYTLDSALTPASLTEANSAGTAHLPPTTYWWKDGLDAGEVVTLTLVTTGSVSAPMEADWVNSSIVVYDGLSQRGPWNLTTHIVVPTIEIVAPTEGEVIGTLTPTTTVSVAVTTTNFTIPGDGFWCFWLDGKKVGPVTNTYSITYPMAFGTHNITAELKLNDGTMITSDAVSFELKAYEVFLPVVMRSYTGTAVLP